MDDILRDGAWKGRRCFILGGGPSLRSLDMSMLAGELTIGLNAGYLKGPTITLVYDLRLMERLAGDPTWDVYSGVKAWLNTEEPNRSYPGVRPLKEFRPRPPKLWPTSFADGIYRGNNAGTAGICLARLLGADVIYLLGYDLRAEAGQPANWHELYPEKWRATSATLATYRADIERIAGHLKGSVVNLTPGSALKAFPCSSIEAVLGSRDAARL